MKKILLGIGIIGVIITAIFYGFAGKDKLSDKLSGDISIETPAITEGLFRSYQFFASSTVPTTIATTTSATSTNITPFYSTSGVKDNGYFVITGAKDVALYFTRGDAGGQGNAGTSTFRIQTSNEGTTWYDYNLLRRATTSIATADAYYTYYPNVVIEAATSTQIMKMAELGYYAIRCIVVEGVDGEHTCQATATY